VSSGLPVRPFSFVGFLPRKGRARRTWLDRIADLPGSVVLFEAPGRLGPTLEDLHQRLGPRRVAIARELTKRFEEVVRGKLGELELPEPRGEVTLVVEGVELDESPALEDEGEIERWLRDQRSRGTTARDLARQLSERSTLTRSQAYRRVLELGSDEPASPQPETLDPESTEPES